MLYDWRKHWNAVAKYIAGEEFAYGFITLWMKKKKGRKEDPLQNSNPNNKQKQGLRDGHVPDFRLNKVNQILTS